MDMNYVAIIKMKFITTLKCNKSQKGTHILRTSNRKFTKFSSVFVCLCLFLQTLEISVI